MEQADWCLLRQMTSVQGLLCSMDLRTVSSWMQLGMEGIKTTRQQHLYLVWIAIDMQRPGSNLESQIFLYLMCLYIFAVFLSQNVQSGTRAQFLWSWMKRLKSYPRCLIYGMCFNFSNWSSSFSMAGKVDVSEEQESEEHAQMLLAAKKVIAGTWRPAFFMIDKVQAEQNACKEGMILITTEPKIPHWCALQSLPMWRFAFASIILWMQSGAGLLLPTWFPAKRQKPGSQSLGKHSWFQKTLTGKFIMHFAQLNTVGWLKTLQLMSLHLTQLSNKSVRSMMFPTSASQYASTARTIAGAQSGEVSISMKYLEVIFTDLSQILWLTLAFLLARHRTRSWAPMTSQRHSSRPPSILSWEWAARNVLTLWGSL